MSLLNKSARGKKLAKAAKKSNLHQELGVYRHAFTDATGKINDIFYRQEPAVPAALAGFGGFAGAANSILNEKFKPKQIVGRAAIGAAVGAALPAAFSGAIGVAHVMAHGGNIRMMGQKPLTGSKQNRSEARKRIIHHAQKHNKERTVGFRNGHVAFDNSGNEGAVSVPTYKDLSWMAHGHPGLQRSINPPSGADLSTAHSFGGTHYVYTANNDVHSYSIPGAIEEKHMDVINQHFDASYMLHRAKLERDFDLSPEHDAVMGHFYNKSLHNIGVTNYKFRLSKETKDKLKNLTPKQIKGIHAAAKEQDSDIKRTFGDIPGRKKNIHKHSMKFGHAEGFHEMKKMTFGNLHKIDRDNDPFRNAAENVEADLANKIEDAFDWLHNNISPMGKFPWKGFQEQIDSATTILGKPFRATFKYVNDNIASAIGKGKYIGFSFDARNRAVDDYMNGHRMHLIRYITETQEQIIHDILSEGLKTGQPPAVTARKIRDVIGLTPSQTQYVQNYRAALENLDPKALTMNLRDKRYDRSVSKAIADNKPLNQEFIDNAVERYRQRAVNMRAMTIARTESLRAATMGGLSAIQTGIMNGSIKDENVIREWRSAGDSRVRHTHQELNGEQVRGMNSVFTIPGGGTIRYPLDPEAPASETVNCRCVLTYRIVPKGTGE